VAAVRLRVADALDDRQPVLPPQRVQALHGRVEADAVPQRQHLARRVGEVRPRLLVGGVGGGHDGVEPVVAAVERDEDEHAAAGRQRVLVRRVEQRAGGDHTAAGGECPGSGHAGRDEELAAGQRH
jgi:hypothetical protein